MAISIFPEQSSSLPQRENLPISAKNLPKRNSDSFSLMLRVLEKSFSRRKEGDPLQIGLETGGQEREKQITQLQERLGETFGQERLKKISKRIGEYVARYQPDKELFARPEKQAGNSDHNILHADIVNALEFLGIEFLDKQGALGRLVREAGLQTDQEVLDQGREHLEMVLGVAGGLHDTQKTQDAWDNIPRWRMLQHAKRAAHNVRKLVTNWEGLNPQLKQQLLDSPSHILEEVVAPLIRYHDDEEKAPVHLREVTGILVFADRMTLGRLFTSKTRISRFTAPGFAQERMRNFVSIIPELQDRSIVHLFSDVGTALHLLGNQYIRDNCAGISSPQNQKKAIRMALSELFGLEQSQHRESPAPRATAA